MVRLQHRHNDCTATNTFWVSDLRGAGMRCLGEIGVNYGVDYDTNVYTDWIPGDREIAVTRDKMMYAVPL